MSIVCLISECESFLSQFYFQFYMPMSALNLGFLDVHTHSMIKKHKMRVLSVTW